MAKNKNSFGLSKNVQYGIGVIGAIVILLILYSIYSMMNKPDQTKTSNATLEAPSDEDSSDTESMMDDNDVTTMPMDITTMPMDVTKPVVTTIPVVTTTPVVTLPVPQKSYDGYINNFTEGGAGPERGDQGCLTYINNYNKNKADADKIIAYTLRDNNQGTLSNTCMYYTNAQLSPESSKIISTSGSNMHNTTRCVNDLDPSNKCLPPTVSVAPPLQCSETQKTYAEGARCIGAEYRQTQEWCCSPYGSSKCYKWKVSS